MKTYTNVASSGDKILARGFDGEGNRFEEEVLDFHPRLWVPCASKAAASDWHTIHGYPVQLHDAGGIKAARKFIAQCKDAGNSSVYGDIAPQYQYIASEYEIKPEQLEHLDQIVIDNIDIETEAHEGPGGWEADKAEQRINLITIERRHKGANKKYTFGLEPYTGTTKTKYYHCADESELLSKLFRLWKKKGHPDVLTGWHINGFDVPYVIRRTAKVLSESATGKLSPWGLKPKSKEKTDKFGKIQEVFTIPGVSILDYKDLYMKFSPKGKQERYTLNYIAEVEGIKGKLDYSSYGTLKRLYQEDWNLFVDYNVQDVEIVGQLEAKLKYTELACIIAYIFNANFEDVFAPTKIWDAKIYNHLLSKGLVVPTKQFADKKEKYKGAWVKHPKKGKYGYVVSFDLTSLYPMLILQFNISPELLYPEKLELSIEAFVNGNVPTDMLLERNLSLAANGHMFSRKERGFLPELMEWLFKQRKAYNKQRLETESEVEALKAAGSPYKELRTKAARLNAFQQAFKICLNSAYGALGQQNFRWYDTRLATAITLSGQVAILRVTGMINRWLNKQLGTDEDFIITADTDSMYIDISLLVSRLNPANGPTLNQVDALAKGPFAQVIKKAFAEYARDTNAFENRMDMKREAIADSAIWGATKQYAMHVLDSEGVQYDPPVVKVKGLASVRSTTPGVCRKKLKDFIGIVLCNEEDDAQLFIAKFRKEFHALPVELIAAPTGVKQIDKWKDASSRLYRKGTPIQSKSAIIHNNLVKKLGLENEYELIKGGDHIKYVLLKKFNPIQQPVVAFSDKLPAEFKVDEYVDRDVMFEKVFMSQARKLLDLLEWKEFPHYSLDDGW